MYTVKLEKFEGPLDLLLDLIEKDKMDISDVSLSAITDEFLTYLVHFQEKSPSYLADFLVIAAKMILIKSKTLLPSFAVTEDEDREITELKERLADYQRIREGARLIGVLERKHMSAYHKHSELRHVRVFLFPVGVTPETLHGHFFSLWQAGMQKQELEEKKLEYIVSFEERMQDIRSRLEQSVRLGFSALTDAGSKVNVIMSFLAILELVKQRFIEVEQDALFGEIDIVKT